MAPKPDQNDQTDTDDLEAPGDETSDFIRQQIEAQTADDGDGDDLGGFDQPMTDPEDGGRETVSQAKGAELAAEARIKGGTGDEEDAPEGDGDDPEPEVKAEDDTKGKDDPKPEAKDDKGDDPADLTAADVASLLDGVPDDRRAEVSRRLDAASKVLSPFESAENKAQLDALGTTPEAAVNRMIELSNFARSNPDEYIAWVARETGGEKAAEMLGKAAEFLGMKLVADGGADDEPDPFEDPEVKALREENARLKAGNNATNFGPDKPERVQARDVQASLGSLINEVDPATNQLVRPYFNALQPAIAAKAQAHVAATQQPATPADIARFYDEAVTETQALFAPPGDTPAAQDTPNVADQIKTKAAAAKKAANASKSIDGSGPGAPRRPALAADADLDDVIRDAIAKQTA